MQKEKDFMLFGLKPEQTSYKGILLFFGIYFGATLFAAVLTPPVYWAFHHFWPDMPAWLARKRIDIFFDRIRYIPIVLGLPVMIKVCKLGSIANLGLSFTKKNMLHFVKYLLVGIAIAALVFGIQIGFANVTYKPMDFDSVADLASKVVLSWIAGAFLVALLEEIIFRALTFRCIYTALGTVWAIVLTSAFFAYKHFHVPSSIYNDIPDGGKVAHWWIGFVVAWYDTVGVFMTWDTVMFAALFAFGAVLSMIYVRTKVLWGPIGFHMGVVLAIFVYKANARLEFTETEKFIFGGANPSSGLLGATVLFAMLGVLAYLHWNENKKLQTAETKAL